MYRDLVEYLVKALVGDAEKVSVTETKNEDRLVITVKVDSQDMGRVIGKMEEL